MTNSFFESAFAIIEKQDDKGKIKSVDYLIEYLSIQTQNLYKLKLSIWLEKQAKTYQGEWWTEKEITKQQANALFSEFLELYENAHGEKYDNFNPFHKAYHFENWKAFMKWSFRRIHKLD
jgi:hypothetical protein